MCDGEGDIPEDSLMLKSIIQWKSRFSWAVPCPQCGGTGYKKHRYSTKPIRNPHSMPIMEISCVNSVCAPPPGGGNGTGDSCNHNWKPLFSPIWMQICSKCGQSRS